MTYENYDNIANVLDYGATPYSNSTTSTADSTQAFMDAIATGKPVYAPNVEGLGTVYNVALGGLPDGFKLFGHSATTNYNGTNPNANVILRGITGASAVIDTSGVNSYHIEGVTVEGLSRSMRGIGAITEKDTYALIVNVSARDCSVGIGGSAGIFMQAAKVINCQARENSTGFGYGVDAMYVNCTAIGNLNSGFYLPAGCNRNQITNVRSEWNNTYGVWLADSEENIITSLMADRNGGAGLQISSAKGVTANGLNLSRNGRLYDAVNAQHLSCHIGLSGAWSNVDLRGVNTFTGNDDDGQGYVSPEFAIRLTGTGGDKLHIDGMLDGYTSAMIDGSFDVGAKVSIFDRTGTNAPVIQNMPYSVFNL